jgi:hypothetical protein
MFISPSFPASPWFGNRRDSLNLVSTVADRCQDTVGGKPNAGSVLAEILQCEISM